MRSYYFLVKVTPNKNSCPINPAFIRQDIREIFTHDEQRVSVKSVRKPKEKKCKVRQ